MLSRLLFTIFVSWVLAFSATATVEIVTTTTELAWLARQIGAEKVNVQSLLDGSENPHFLDATPSFILAVSNADIFCINGLDLEVGWVPRVVEKAANAKIQSGGNGYCDASSKVQKLETKDKSKISRAQGDVHPSGNPHYTLSSKQMRRAAESIAEALIQTDSVNSEYYFKQLQAVQTKLDQLFLESQEKLKAVTPLSALQYHKEFSYFFNDYKIANVGSVEETPGVPPSALRLVQISLVAKQKKVRFLLSTQLYPENHLKKVSELSGVPFAILPGHLSKKHDGNYIKFHQALVDGIIKVVHGKK